MSRIGRTPVVIPEGVQVDIKGSFVKVKGQKGEMQRQFSYLMEIALEDGQVVIKRKSDHPTERADDLRPHPQNPRNCSTRSCY